MGENTALLAPDVDEGSRSDLRNSLNVACDSRGIFVHLVDEDEKSPMRENRAVLIKIT
jgi:hypothetical protein